MLCTCFQLFKFLAESDYSITDQPIEIPVGESEICFQLLAVDDEIVESEEEFTLIIQPTNPNDILDGNVTINIIDDDCKDYKTCKKLFTLIC